MRSRKRWLPTSSQKPSPTRLDGSAFAFLVNIVDRDIFYDLVASSVPDPAGGGIFLDSGDHSAAPTHDNNPKNNKGYECQSCDFKTSRRTGLTDHINAVHDKLKLYMCQHCSHTFASNGNLTQHIQAVHEKLRPFICQYCTYATSSQPNLRKHIKAVHHKIRDFKCNICPFDAASKQLLVRHVQAVHEKIKGYKCKYCQYECAKGYNMKVHIRHVHEKQKGYKCDQCSFEATRRGKLTEHQLACHGISLSNQTSCDGETPEAETIIVQSAIETRSILVE